MKRTNRSGFAGYIVTLIAGILIGVLGIRYYERPQTHTVQPTSDDETFVIENFTLSHTSADFEEAILEESRQTAELVLFEQDTSVATTITRAGLGNWEIFTKYQNIVYYGTGVYTIDLSQINDITVDNDEKTIYVTIPHTQLKYVTIDLAQTKFSDTEHGLLSFGDIKLTPEEQSLVQQQMENTMRERLEDSNMLSQVDEIALVKVKDILTSAIYPVSPSYTIQVQFD